MGADELAVAVFLNRAETNPGPIVYGVVALYEPVLAPFTVPIEDREPEVTGKVRDLLVQVGVKKVDAAEFAYLRGGFNVRFVDDLAGSGWDGIRVRVVSSRAGAGRRLAVRRPGSPCP